LRRKERKWALEAQDAMAFSRGAVAEVVKRGKKVMVPEMNQGQVVGR